MNKTQKKPKCLKCKKELTEIRDPIAKKKTGHLWKCSCMPGVIISIG